MSARRATAVAAAVALAGGLAWLALQPSGPAPAPPGGGGGGNGNGAPGRNGDPAPPASGAPLVFSSPADCKACHADVYAEWDASKHRQSYTDPFVRQLTDDFRDVTCLSCHVPQPIHMTSLGDQVFERSGRLETGVDCLSCHLLADGGVAASRDLPGAPCRPRRVEAQGTHLACAGCHNQHWLVDDWRDLFAKPDASRGALLAVGRKESCNDCHMPPVERKGADGAARAGRSHLFPGGHDPRMHRDAMRLGARVEKGRVLVEVENHGVGHRAPGDSRHKSYNVWITVTTEGGARLADRVEIAEYRMYYRTPPRDNTNLRPGEVGRSAYDLPAGTAGKARVQLVFAKDPVAKEAKKMDRILVVHEAEVAFDTR